MMTNHTAPNAHTGSCGYQTNLTTSPTDLSDGIGQKHHTHTAFRYQVDTSMDSHLHTSGNLLTANGLLLHSYRPLTNSTYRSLGHDDQMHNHLLKGRATNIEVIGGGYGTPSEASGPVSELIVGAQTMASSGLSDPRTVGQATPPSGNLTLAAPGRINPFLASAGAETRLKSSSTRKQNLTRAEIDADKAVTAAKKAERIQKAAQKQEDQRQRLAAKEARAALKVLDAGTPTPRFVWSKEASLEPLRYVKEIKEEHDDLIEKTPGFIAWTPYFLKCEADRGDYPLLIGIANDVILRRYRVLMNMWKVVFDKLSHSGSGGLYEILAKEHLSETVTIIWDFINAMHGDNAAANAHGHAELDDDLGALLCEDGRGEGREARTGAEAESSQEASQLLRD
ncbi:hypothetical protein PGTUg99_003265 [Puccinia graminis f. sp. tritici]|uniref:Uncharacterized protein n=1 Tax=Puccinia graminis f. sp. tritici TaxID=56615 RepID=A0A5B0NVQ0_PUCGR|nr:hypothetical protein PGTUg99_003265 [Puccinia graminis f. sp. tritici]